MPPSGAGGGGRPGACWGVLPRGILAAMRPRLAALAAAVLACGDAAERPQGKAEANPMMPDRVQAPPPAPRREVVSTCPKELSAPESVERLIGRECGTVTVQPGYRIEGGSLTVDAGVTLAFAPGAGLTVGYEQPSRLVIRGTAQDPVKLTSATDARYPGAWKGIALYEQADRSEIVGAVIEYAGNNLRGTINVQAEDVKVEDSIVRDCAGVAVHVTSKGHLASFSGNRLERVSSPAILVPANSVGAIAVDNVLPAESIVHVLGGRISDRTRWSALPVPYVIGGPVEIEGPDDKHEALLELSPGVTLKFDEDAFFTVGYDHPATLLAEADGQAPIVMTSATKPVSQAWRGINLYKSATASFSNVVFEFGGQRSDRGVLYANSEARLSVRGCKFRDNGGGVTLQGGAVRISAFAGNSFERSHPAFDVHAQSFGLIGADNQLDRDTRIVLEGGSIERDAVWHHYGVPVDATGPVSVDGGATLTIRAGVKLTVRDGWSLGIGELDGGTLRVEGSAEAPVTIVGASDRRGTWDAIRLYDRARNNVIEHLKLRNAGGEGAVNVASGVDAIVRDVGCERCYSPTLAWACGAKVTHERVTASAETPAPTLAPFGCDGG
jgi:hypothetical protein